MKENIYNLNSPSGVVQSILKYKKSGSVLDLGTGKGRNARFLAKKKFKVTATDQDEETVKKLRSSLKGLDVKVKRENILDFKTNKTFDVVVVINVLHFLKKSQIPKVFHKIKKATKPNGLNVISVHTDKNKKSSRPHLFKTNELKNYYKDWNVLEYVEKLGLPFTHPITEKTVRKYRATIIAQKPE